MRSLYDFSIFDDGIGCLKRQSLLGGPPLLDVYSAPDDRIDGNNAPEPYDLPKTRDKQSQTQYEYRCPICGKVHLVNETRHRLAYGRQLTCRCECEVQRRKKVKMKWRSMSRRL